MDQSNRFTISDYVDMDDYDNHVTNTSAAPKVEAGGPSRSHRPLPSIPMASPISPLGPGPSPQPASPETTSTLHEPSPPRSTPLNITYPPRAYTNDGQISQPQSQPQARQQDYFSDRSSTATGMLSPRGTAFSPLSPGSVLMSPRSELGAPEEKYGFDEPQDPPPRSTAGAPQPSLADKLFPKSWPCRLLLIVVFLEAVIDIAVQANLLWRFNIEQEWMALGGDEVEQRRLPYFVGIFAAAHIVQFALTMYAIYSRNMVQVVALAIFNALLLIYAGFQIGEITTILGTATESLDSHKFLTLPTKILSGLVIGVIAAAQIAIVLLSYSIWKEFGWRIYRFLGADLNIRRYYLQYQIFECIICFSFFFFAGFGVQFIGMVLNKTDPEFILTIVMLPASLVWLIIGIISARYEVVWLMSTFLVGLLGGIAYFIFKFIRIFTDSERYVGVQKSLGVFCMLSLVMILLCLVYGCIVWNNFNKGLKQAVKSDKREPQDQERYSELGPVVASPAVKKAHRITID